MKITFISDTHTKHYQLTEDLPGGDMIMFAGDMMSDGYSKDELHDFCKWYNGLPYTHRVLIAGNHDRMFQMFPNSANAIVNQYDNLTYLQDEADQFEGVVVYGSPWQPEFHNWAFNLPRNSNELKAKWDTIPAGIDILMTHGPAQTYLDKSGFPYNQPLLGCELLKDWVELNQPKIHVFGHIHGGAGYYFNGHTHFINASVLNEQYMYRNNPITVEWDKETNELKFI